MRMILIGLALFNARWASADLARADFLQRQIDKAQDRAAAHLVLADGFARRARLCR